MNKSRLIILRFSLGFSIFVVIYLIGVLILPFVYALYISPTIPPTSLGTQFVKNTIVGKAKLKIAVIGDSTALGQGSDSQLNSFSYQYTNRYLSQKYSQISYVNFAVSGNKAQDVIENQLDKLTLLKPDLIFVAMGANDVTGGTDKNIFKYEISDIVDFLKKLGTKVIWLSIPDFITSQLLLPPLNWYLSNTAKEFDNIIKNSLKTSDFVYVDVFDSTRQAFLNQPGKMFSVDKYHPSVDGYGLWVEQINKTLPVNFL